MAANFPPISQEMVPTTAAEAYEMGSLQQATQGEFAVPDLTQEQLNLTYAKWVEQLNILGRLLAEASNNIRRVAIYQGVTISYDVIWNGIIELKERIRNLQMKMSAFQVIPAAITPFNVFSEFDSFGATSAEKEAARTAKIAAKAQAKASSVAASNARKVAAYQRENSAFQAKMNANPAKAASYTKAITKNNAAIAKYGGTPTVIATGSTGTGSQPIPTPPGAVVSPDPAVQPASSAPTTYFYPSGGAVDPNYGPVLPDSNYLPQGGQGWSDEYNPFAQDNQYYNYDTEIPNGYYTQPQNPAAAQLTGYQQQEQDYQYSPFPFFGPFDFIETQGFVQNWDVPFGSDNAAQNEANLLDEMQDQWGNRDNVYVEQPIDWFLSPFGEDTSVRSVKIDGFAGIEQIIGGLISAGGAIGAAALAPKPPKQVVQAAPIQQASSMNSMMPMAILGLGGLALVAVLMSRKGKR